MSHPGHHKTVCSECNTLIGQCRCMDSDKVTYYEICPACAKKHFNAVVHEINKTPSYTQLKERNEKLIKVLKNIMSFEIGAFTDAKDLLEEIEKENQ